MRIAIVCEDQAHRTLATMIADNVLLQEALQRSADWIDEETLPALRQYCGRHDTAATPEHLRFYSLAQAQRDTEELGKYIRIGDRPVKLHGHIDGQPLKPEAGFWRRIFLLLASLDPPPDALIVVHDTDGQLERLDGLAQARRLVPDNISLIIGTPHQDAEAWFVAGFVPHTDPERARLRQQTDALEFSPPQKPHRLTAHPNSASTDAKRVLRILVFDENTSRPPTIDELPALGKRTLSDLGLLANGQECLLAAFLQELRTILVPLFIPGPPPPP